MGWDGIVRLGRASRECNGIGIQIYRKGALGLYSARCFTQRCTLAGIVLELGKGHAEVASSESIPNARSRGAGEHVGD